MTAQERCSGCFAEFAEREPDLGLALDRVHHRYDRPLLVGRSQVAAPDTAKIRIGIGPWFGAGDPANPDVGPNQEQRQQQPPA